MRRDVGASDEGDSILTFRDARGTATCSSEMMTSIIVFSPGLHSGRLKIILIGSM